jgi:uncharacterized protein (TIGR03437 family)
VLLDDVAAPLYFVAPRQVNFLIPHTAPSSGLVEMQVVRASTGEILASSLVRMDLSSPALFTKNNTGAGQVAALNEDNSENASTNPAARGSVIQLFGTGQGPVPGAPADGSPPGAALETSERPRVFIGSRFVDDSEISYSGLAPTLVGLWQINVRIPDFVPPGSSIPVFVVMNDVPSGTAPIRTTIAVR